MNWRTLITCKNEPEANVLKAKLAGHGIQVLILDTNVNSLAYYAAAVPIRVQVREADFISAKRLVIDPGDGDLLSLENLEALALDYPHPNEQFLEKCPSCGGTDVSYYEDPEKGGIGKFVGKRIRRCECGYEWK